jgi:hypothetical protein
VIKEIEMIRKGGRDLVELRLQKMLEESEENRKEIQSLYAVPWQRIDPSVVLLLHLWGFHSVVKSSKHVVRIK